LCDYLSNPLATGVRPSASGLIELRMRGLIESIDGLFLKATGYEGPAVKIRPYWDLKPSPSMALPRHKEHGI